jgi:hypothetical protein
MLQISSAGNVGDRAAASACETSGASVAATIASIAIQLVARIVRLFLMVSDRTAMHARHRDSRAPCPPRDARPARHAARRWPSDRAVRQQARDALPRLALHHRGIELACTRACRCTDAARDARASPDAG